MIDNTSGGRMKAYFATTALAFMITCAASGCVSSSDELEGHPETARGRAAIEAEECVLTVITDVAPQDKVVIIVNDFFFRDCFGSCQYTIMAGSEVILRVPFPTDHINCIQFTGWGGDCKDEGNPCYETCPRRMSVNAIWTQIAGCEAQ
jgi:hypothetical protein